MRDVLVLPGCEGEIILTVFSPMPSACRVWGTRGVSPSLMG